MGVMAFFAILATSNAPGAEEGEYKSPDKFYNMEAHLAWCAEGKTVVARIKRYEYFWSLQSPKESGMYDDGRHVRLVRRCAYRLAELYAQSGRKKDFIEMLKWLEKEDDAFDINKTG
jgi:hypothetical protein